MRSVEVLECLPPIPWFVQSFYNNNIKTIPENININKIMIKSPSIISLKSNIQIIISKWYGYSSKLCASQLYISKFAIITSSELV